MRPVCGQLYRDSRGRCDRLSIKQAPVPANHARRDRDQGQKPPILSGVLENVSFRVHLKQIKS